MIHCTPRKIVFLCSGGGGNLRFLYEAITRRWIEGTTIDAVLCDRPCPAHDFALAHGLQGEVIDFADPEQRELGIRLAHLAPDIIVTNVHKILRPTIVEAHRGKLVNLHYSLLPAFGGVIGMRPVKAALAYGARFAGVTAHHVTEHVDAGAPIVQVVIPLEAGEDFSDTLAHLVFRSGCLALLAAIDSIGRQPAKSAPRLIELVGRACFFSGDSIACIPETIDEAFWQGIAAQAPAHSASPVVG